MAIQVDGSLTTRSHELQRIMLVMRVFSERRQTAVFQEMITLELGWNFKNCRSLITRAVANLSFFFFGRSRCDIQ